MTPRRVLVVKTSSFGDVVHTFPAVTDAAAALPGVAIDWLVEPAFASLAALHPAVRRVVPAPVRALKRANAAGFREALAALRVLRAERYDAVVDAQGLIKSALLGRLARGPTHGHAAPREKPAAWLTGRRHETGGGYENIEAHVVERTRRLFALALGYPLPAAAPDSGLDRARLAGGDAPTRAVILAHGTAWPDKLWPTESWRQLARRIAAEGFLPRVPFQGASEEARARAIVEGVPQAALLHPLPFPALAAELARAAAVVAGDTGIAHLADALRVPVVTVFGPTTPRWSGGLGPAAAAVETRDGVCPIRPCLARRCRIAPADPIAPCMASIAPEAVWPALRVRLPRAASV